MKIMWPCLVDSKQWPSLEECLTLPHGNCIFRALQHSHSLMAAPFSRSAPTSAHVGAERKQIESPIPSNKLMYICRSRAPSAPISSVTRAHRERQSDLRRRIRLRIRTGDHFACDLMHRRRRGRRRRRPSCGTGSCLAMILRRPPFHSRSPAGVGCISARTRTAVRRFEEAEARLYVYTVSAPLSRGRRFAFQLRGCGPATTTP